MSQVMHYRQPGKGKIHKQQHGGRVDKRFWAVTLHVSLCARRQRGLGLQLQHQLLISTLMA